MARAKKAPDEPGDGMIPGLGVEGDPAATWKPIGFVKRWDRNPRVNAKTVPKVVRSMRRFGFGAPLITRSDGTLIAGDTRIQAAHVIGLAVVPVRVMDHLSDEEAEALAIADNRIAEESDWAPDMLEKVLQALDPTLRELAGYSETQLARLHATNDTRSRAKGEPVYSTEAIIEAAFEHFRETGFPFKRLPIWECMKEINQLTQTESPIGSVLGYAVADTFHPHRMAGAAHGKRSPVESFGIDASMRKAISLALENGSSVLSMLQLVNGTQACSNFRPGFALHLYRRFTEEGATILDTSTGYGGRLVGFIASGRAKYIGIDPNVETHAANVRMAEALGVSARVELHNLPAEDVDHAVVKGRCDFAFTSPPYFRKEHYSQDETQSWKRYPEGDAWRTCFLERMIALQHAALKRGGRSIINIADVKIGARLYPLVEWTVEAAKAAGFKLEAREVFPMSAHFGKGDDARAVDGDGVAEEPVLIFRKP